MTNMTKLDASNYICGIGDSSISKLDLIELFACNNPKITNVNHMTNLIIFSRS